MRATRASVSMLTMYGRSRHHRPPSSGTSSGSRADILGQFASDCSPRSWSDEIEVLSRRARARSCAGAGAGTGRMIDEYGTQGRPFETDRLRRPFWDPGTPIGFADSSSGPAGRRPAAGLSSRARDVRGAASARAEEWLTAERVNRSPRTSAVPPHRVSAIAGRAYGRASGRGGCDGEGTLRTLTDSVGQLLRSEPRVSAPHRVRTHDRPPDSSVAGRDRAAARCTQWTHRVGVPPFASGPASAAGPRGRADPRQPDPHGTPPREPRLPQRHCSATR